MAKQKTTEVTITEGDSVTVEGVTIAFEKSGTIQQGREPERVTAVLTVTQRGD